MTVYLLMSFTQFPENTEPSELMITFSVPD